MRRGNPRGRGYNRPLHQPQNSNPRQPSPLMANHLQLQGLKDIDMELQLLKRKREIIEQQQEILSNNYRPRNNYEQPAFNQSRDNRYGDYARLYDEPRESNHLGGGGGSSSRKRAYIPVWEHETAPKRFSAPSRGVKAIGARVAPPPQDSRPDFQARPAAPKSFKRPTQFVPPQKKKEFNPTKVTKRTAAPPPVKLASYPTAERKKLVTATLTNPPAKARASLANPDTWILRADQEPSRQMVGRMELALGAIMKDLRQANPQYEELFRAPSSTRAMKQAVRDRIRTAMMGKVISTSDNIQASYYEMYPPTDDNDVVMRGLETQKGSEFFIVQSDSPEVYFKKNIYRLMSRKLEEMTSRLEEIYKGNNATFTPGKGYIPRKHYRAHLWRSKRHVTRSNTENKTEVSQTDIENKQPQPKDGVSNAEDAVVKTDDVEVNTDDVEVNKDDVEIKVEDGKNKIVDDNNSQPKTEDGHSKKDDSLIKTEVNPQINILSNENGTESNANKEQVKPDEDQVILDKEQVKPDEEQAMPNEETVNVDGSNAQSDGLPSTPKVYTNEVPKQFRNQGVVSIEQYKAFDALMTFKMIHLVKKFAPSLLKAMDIDAMYRRTKAAIINDIKKKLEGTPDVLATSAPVKKDENRFLPPLQYYVKIIGKPGLPKRKAMETFFEDFKPKSVKKHRTMYNLLFVGFAEKEPYEKILAANGTVIGRNTLDIRVSERSIDNKKNENDANNPAEKGLNDSGSQVIGSDLDEQITDLLTSIRDESDNFSEDIVMSEPPAQNDNKENETETAKVGADIAQGDKKDNDIIEIEDVAENNDDVVEIKDVPQNNEDVVEIRDVPQNDEDIVEVKDVPQTTGAVNVSSVQVVDNGNAETADDNEEAEKQDTVQALKTDTVVKSTPTRTSARLTTPSGIRTRRMSKLE